MFSLQSIPQFHLEAFISDITCNYIPVANIPHKFLLQFCTALSLINILTLDSLKFELVLKFLGKFCTDWKSKQTIILIEEKLLITAPSSISARNNSL